MPQTSHSSSSQLSSLPAINLTIRRVGSCEGSDSRRLNGRNFFVEPTVRGTIGKNPVGVKQCDRPGRRQSCALQADLFVQRVDALFAECIAGKGTDYVLDE